MSLGDRDRFQFRPHDSTLEQTADSQEKDVGDAALEDLPKSSPLQRRIRSSPILFWFLPLVSLLVRNAT
jgi:hypothetical protein